MRDYEYSDLYFDSHLDKQIKIEVVGAGITIDNSMIELDAFELDEILCSEQELTFGSCEANCVKFAARDMPGSIVGKTIRITETVDGNTDSAFPYGVYRVYSDVPTSDRTKREITAYDALYDIVNADMKQWYAGLSFPMTLRQFRDGFFAHFGITQKETTLVNDAMTVNKTLVATQTDSESTITEESAISGKTVVTAICEINGVFGNINRDGEFEYVELEQITNPLYPANDLYPSDDLFPRDPNTISMTGHYITFDYEDFQSKEITQLEIRPDDDSAGAIVGTSGNNYVISGNFLVSDKSGAELSQIAANTLSIIRKAAYTPLISSEVVGNPCIELGDPIRFNTTREIVESYVLQRTLTGIQNKRDSIVSPGTETHDKNPNSIIEKISSVQRRTNKLERTADHTLSELADLDANTSSRFEQTAEQIQMEVSNRQNADNEMTTRISQTAHSIGLTATGGDNSVGITVQLYDENGNLIDTESGNANITIVGVVKFEDLQNAGQTIINGANILTGTVTADKLVAGELTAGRLETSDGKVLIDNGIFRVYSGVVDVQNGSICVGSETSITYDTIQSSVIMALNQLYSSGTIYSAGDISTSGDVTAYDCYLSHALKCTNVGSLSTTSNVAGFNGSGWLVPSSGSSERFKHDIKPLQTYDARKLYELSVDEFIYNDDYIDESDDWYQKVVPGFIAEKMEALLPIIVSHDEYGRPNGWKEKAVIPLMLKLIQEQHEEIESLKSENFALQGGLAILEQRMEELENVINNKINQS